MKAAWLCVVMMIAAAPAMARSPGSAPHGDSGSENSAILKRPPHISCEMVRAYVSEVGLVQARAMALAAGMTPAQERRAARCLENKT